ncbi:MAG TPA: site-specific integrase, partial [Actinomycetota bacterium]|nr:site-specific integrase [Actinomycetota bacterium]
MTATGAAPRSGRKDRSGSKLGRWVDEFLSYIQFEKGLAQNTVQSYRRDLVMWSDFCGRAGVDPASPADGDVTSFMAALRKGAPPASKPMAPSSVA